MNATPTQPAMKAAVTNPMRCFELVKHSHFSRFLIGKKHATILHGLGGTVRNRITCTLPEARRVWVELLNQGYGEF